MRNQLAWNGVLLAVLAPALSACGLFSSGKPTAATCASQQTADGVKSAVFDAAGHSMMTNPRNAKAVGERISATISNAVASNLDEKLARVDCSGDITLNLPDDFQSSMFRNGRTITRRIDYSVQSAADGNGVLYTFAGDEELTNWAGFAAFTFHQPKQPASHSISDEPSPPSPDPGMQQSLEEANPGPVEKKANSTPQRLSGARKSEDASPQASEIASDPHDPTRM